MPGPGRDTHVAANARAKPAVRSQDLPTALSGSTFSRRLWLATIPVIVLFALIERRVIQRPDCGFDQIARAGNALLPRRSLLGSDRGYGVGKVAQH